MIIELSIQVGLAVRPAGSSVSAINVFSEMAVTQIVQKALMMYVVDPITKKKGRRDVNVPMNTPGLASCRAITTLQQNQGINQLLNKFFNQPIP